MIKRGVFKSKKAMDVELLFNIFEILIVFFAAVTLVEFVNTESDRTAFFKEYYARDAALTLNAIYAAPGDIEYQHASKAGKYIFNIKQNEVEVFLPNEVTEGGIVGYPFAEDKSYSLSYTKLEPTPNEDSRTIYKKKKDAISVSR